ncbi:MAG TPA: CoA transferase [Candidatus Binatia bacterium]|jgi:crotonobetainyl-CoA:carnitine CoA-transferase CaiB-like acyl-CoA transferase
MLEGIRVVEMGVWVAGPAVGGILADWGADVVKVESPAGDPMRGFFRASIGSEIPHNPPFDLDNRGKRSIVLDLRTDAARAALEKILAGADVFVSNMRPAALARLGLAHDDLMVRHPRLIVASITGYGLEGEESDRAGYDIGAFWARSGVADLFRTPNQPPLALRGGFGDHITGISTVAGILGALIERGRTGRGRLVETSLLRTGMYCIGWDLGIQLVYDKLRGTPARTENDNPMVNCYQASDGSWFWLIGLEGDRHFPLLCNAMQRKELAVVPRFATPVDRRINRRELIALLDGILGGKTREEWAERFDREGVWWVPVQSAAEAVRDPQALANGAICEVDGEGGRDAYRAIASPVGFRDQGHRTPPSHLRAVPALGADTREVLREAGLSDTEIDALGRS